MVTRFDANEPENAFIQLLDQTGLNYIIWSLLTSYKGYKENKPSLAVACVSVG